MNLLLNITNQNNMDIRLKKGNKVIDKQNLTINHNLDILLITVIDKLLIKNKIDRLSLKGLRVLGKVQKGAVSGMILKTFEIGFKI